MKIKNYLLVLTLIITSVSAHASIWNSIKSALNSCAGSCEAENIKCDNTDVTKKGSLAYCIAQCLGEKQKHLSKYQAGVASCKAQPIEASAPAVPAV